MKVRYVCTYLFLIHTYICIIYACTYVYMYGTSHPQLERSSRMMCVCKIRSLHALWLHACICKCFLALHHKYVRKHMHLHWITTCKTAHTCVWPMAKIFL